MSRNIVFALVLLSASLAACGSGKQKRESDGEIYVYSAKNSNEKLKTEIFPSKGMSITSGFRYGPDGMVGSEKSEFRHSDGIFSYARYVIIPDNFQYLKKWEVNGIHCAKTSINDYNNTSRIRCSDDAMGAEFVMEPQRGVLELAPICNGCLPETFYLESKVGLDHRLLSPNR